MDIFEDTGEVGSIWRMNHDVVQEGCKTMSRQFQNITVVDLDDLLDEHVFMCCLHKWTMLLKLVRPHRNIK